MHLERYYIIISELAGFLKNMVFPEVVKCIYGCTEKFFRAACNELHHVPMEGLGENL